MERFLRRVKNLRMLCSTLRSLMNLRGESTTIAERNHLLVNIIDNDCVRDFPRRELTPQPRVRVLSSDH